MFGYFRAMRRKKAMAALVAEFPAILAPLHPTMKAAALILANMTLDMGASVHGPLLRSNPAKADMETAGAAFDSLVRLREGLMPLAMDPKSPHSKQAMAGRMSAGIAAMTIGLAIDNSIGSRRSVTLSWRTLWAEQGHMRDAVVWFRRYEANSSVEAVPRKLDGQIPSDMDLLRLGKRVPSFLSKSKPKA